MARIPLRFETSLARWKRLDRKLEGAGRAGLGGVDRLRSAPFGSISLVVADGRSEQVLVVVDPDELAGPVHP